KKTPGTFRDNSCVAAKIEEDRFAHRPGVQPEFRTRWAYGRVLFYMGLTTDTGSHKLAFVHWARQPSMDEHGLFHFSGFAHRSFIEVHGIDRSVGFWPKEGAPTQFYLIDREVTEKA
ncbi:hypothetical protein HDU96_000464, partial [Phlyctochytrium bullatum]